MDARIVEFAEVLRQNGLRVSPSEVQDAALATEAVGLEDRDAFRSALRATLVKREVDRETFDRVFDFYFSGAARSFEALDASLAQRIREQGLLEGDDLKKLVAALGDLGGQLSPLTQAALAGDAARLASLFRNATLQLDLSRLQTPLQAGFYARRLTAAAGGDALESDLKSLAGELKARGLSPEGVEIVARELGEVLRAVEEAARKEIHRQIRARVRRQPGATLFDRELHTLSPEEVEKAEVAVRRLAERLKSRLVRKQRSYRRGQLNVRRTLRGNMTWGGVPMVPYFRRRRPQRPDVVVLCDISDSVRNVSRLMLLFTWTLQSLFFRVRSFVFVSDIGEVTEHFRQLDLDQAVDVATAGKDISLYANSNYGRAFALFARDHLGGLSRRTTVMVIGDGRNNYNPNSLWALKDVRRKAKRLLWICPEDERNWGIGDSEMPAYAKICHQVVTVKTVNDLLGLADELIPAA
ncbi:MAG: VWA domain-containing protein [Myxococcaceae bacterium]|nr:VWA domain-containing protein [Myxococcaceae bacterium]